MLVHRLVEIPLATVAQLEERLDAVPAGRLHLESRLGLLDLIAGFLDLGFEIVHRNFVRPARFVLVHLEGQLGHLDLELGGGEVGLVLGLLILVPDSRLDLCRLRRFKQHRLGVDPVLERCRVEFDQQIPLLDGGAVGNERENACPRLSGDRFQVAEDLGLFLARQGPAFGDRDREVLALDGVVDQRVGHLQFPGTRGLRRCLRLAVGVGPRGEGQHRGTRQPATDAQAGPGGDAGRLRFGPSRNVGEWARRGRRGDRWGRLGRRRRGVNGPVGRGRLARQSKIETAPPCGLCLRRGGGQQAHGRISSRLWRTVPRKKQANSRGGRLSLGRGTGLPQRSIRELTGRL